MNRVEEIDAKHCKLMKIDENSDKFQFGQWTRTHSIGCDAMRSVDSDKFIRTHEKQSCELVPLKIVASVFYDLDIENYFYSDKKLPIRKHTQRDFTEKPPNQLFDFPSHSFFLKKTKKEILQTNLGNSKHFGRFSVSFR